MHLTRVPGWLWGSCMLTSRHFAQRASAQETNNACRSGCFVSSSVPQGPAITCDTSLTMKLKLAADLAPPFPPGAGSSGLDSNTPWQSLCQSAIETW